MCKVFFRAELVIITRNDPSILRILANQQLSPFSVCRITTNE